MRVVGFVSILIIWVTLAAVHGAASAQPGAGQDGLPFEEGLGGRFEVEAMVNGVGPLRFFLDSAASHSLLFERGRERLGLERLKGRSATVNTTFGTVQLPLAQGVRIDAGGRRLELDEVIIVPDWDSVYAPHGVLGLDFLAHGTVYFDFEDKVLRFYEERPDLLNKGFAKTDLEPERIGGSRIFLYFTDLRIDRRRFRAMVDFGAEATIINRRAASELGFSPTDVPYEESVMFDAYGIRRAVQGIRARRISAGRKSWRDRTIWIADLDIFRSFGRENRPAVILGLDLLREQNFAFDFDGKSLYLKRR